MYQISKFFDEDSDIASTKECHNSAIVFVQRPLFKTAPKVVIGRACLAYSTPKVWDQCWLVAELTDV